MTSFVFPTASARAQVVSSGIASRYIHDFQEVLYLSYVPVQVFTPEIPSEPCQYRIYLCRKGGRKMELPIHEGSPQYKAAGYLCI